MKTKLQLLFILALLPIFSSAASISLTFSGFTTEGRYCLLDSVHIENITHNWETTLDCSQDTTFDFNISNVTTGMDNVETPTTTKGLISNCQTYGLGSSLFTINPLNDGIVSIRVFNTSGHLIIMHQEYLNAGFHQYALHLSQMQTYILSVITETETDVEKIVNMGCSSHCNLYRTSSVPSIPQYTSRRNSPNNGGELMRYVGYTTQRGQVVASDTIIQYQSSDEHIVFTFTSVAKSTEGMYVSMMGFNSELYSYDFDILESSNLTKHQQWVSNLGMRSGTILYHAVHTSLGNMMLAPVPVKLENISLVTFTDGLDFNSWRMNSNYRSNEAYLNAVSKQIGRTYIDGIKLDAYAIGVKGSDVTDINRFENDLHLLSSAPENVYSVSNMDEVNARFREIAANIYNKKVEYSLTIKLPAPEPNSKIRFTFDDVTDAVNSIYYIEGIYDYDFDNYQGSLTNVTYYGLQCDNGSTWTSVPDGIFDIFKISNLSNSLGERVSTTKMKQWIYIPSTGKWQINSEFDTQLHTATTEERTSAIVALVLDCSSSLDSDFSKMQSAANSFLSILAGKGNISKASVSKTSCTLGDLQATLKSSVSNTGNLNILDKGFCVSEYPNMDNATFYSAGEGVDNFEYTIGNLVEGQTYYCCSYATNQLGTTYGEIMSFTAVVAISPTVVLLSSEVVSADSAVCIGEVTFDGYSPIIERGFCWGTAPDPTISDNVVVAESNENKFSSTLTNLVCHTEYYIRAYAKNAKGISYSASRKFFIFAIIYEASNKLSEVINFTDDGIKLAELGSSSNIEFHKFNNGIGTIVLKNPLNDIGHAFCYCSSLTSITIPNSVTSIGDNAFAGCSSLTSITIPNSVTSIGDNAFNGCSSLTSITIPNSVTSIGDLAFCNCSSLSSITIPNSVTSIGLRAFEDCSSLTSITIPNSVTSIGDAVFYGCSSLTSITIPNSVTSIGEAVFYGCSSLTSITIPNGVTNIGSRAFGNCSSLDSIVWNAKNYPDLSISYYDDLFLHIRSHITNFVYGDSVEHIPADLCCSMDNLTSITIPNSVSSIGRSAFNYCSSLTSVTIGNNVTSIGSWAFAFCSSLASVTIPNSVTSIGDHAFYDCSSLTSIKCEAITPPTIGSSTFYGISTLIPVYVPCGCVEVYKAANGWSKFSNIQEPLAEYSIEVSVNDSIMGTAKVDINNACGAQISAAPTLGYRFIQWSDGVTDNPRAIILTQDTSFTAEFAPNHYTISTQCNDTARGTTFGDTIADYLDHVTISATANYGYHFVQWNDGITDNPRAIILTQDTSFTAEFAPNHYTISTQCNDAARGTTFGDTIAAYLDDVTISATANYGYHFVQWNDGITDNPRTLELTQDTSFTAEFAPNHYTISTQCNDAARGTTFGDTIAAYLDDVTISATANYGYHFTNWNDGNTETPRVVKVTSDKTYTAYFEKNTYYVTKKCNTNEGCINGPSSGEYLDNITLIAKPNYGYHFVQWSDGNSNNTLQFILTQDTSCTAEFSQTITGQCGDNLYWSYQNNTLTISGFGEMYNERPWGLFANDIQNVVLPDGITHIGDDAFSNCVELSEIIIPYTVTSIGDYAFAGCSKLVRVNCYATKPPIAETTSFENYNVYLNVPCDNLQDYQLDIIFGSFKNIQCVGTESYNVPTVTTNAITQITQTTAVAGGNVKAHGGVCVTERGVVYSTSPTPTTTDNKIICGIGTGAFTCKLTNLQVGTTYYVRAYAVNNIGTAYGEELSFSTFEIPKFSVSENKQITFSKGNLQYTRSTKTWSFAENQWDYIGIDNVTGGSVSYDDYGAIEKEGNALADKIDLFGWSASNKKNFGVSISLNSSFYSGSFVDWGANKIGVDTPNTWRTLTYNEWEYLLDTRTNASSLRGVAQINGVNGLILLPDNWVCPSGVNFKSGFSEKSFNANYYADYQTFTTDQWSKLETAGAVFLPAAGNRAGSDVYSVQVWGNYWSATKNDSSKPINLEFLPQMKLLRENDCFGGNSVRLVKDL